MYQSPPQLSEVDLSLKVASRKDYEVALDQLQLKLLRLQRSDFMQGGRTILVFEGSDAAGKGGAIKRLTTKLDPRGFTVHAIAAPKPENQAKHYLYRFWQKLPGEGHWAIFDRSWYGRVLVERIEGLCPPERVEQAYQEICEFERTLQDDGVRIIKLFMHISKDEQLRRLQARFKNPEKRWKLSWEDIRNREKWDDYTTAIQDMFNRTSPTSCPWQVISAEQKMHGRLQALGGIASLLETEIPVQKRLLEPELEKKLAKALGVSHSTGPD